VEGYDVITSDEHKLGRVVGTIGDNVVVEHGTLRKTRHAVPKAFVHVDNGEKVVRLTVSKELVEESPKVQDEFDARAVAEHYGLASGYDAPATMGDGELLPDDPALTAEDDELRAGIPTAEQERLRARRGDVTPASRGNLDRLDLAEAALREGCKERLAIRSLVVPAEDDLAHQVRVRELESLLASEHRREAADAPLAADPADLDRLRPERHRRQATVRATRSAQTAARPSARPTSSWRAASGSPKRAVPSRSKSSAASSRAGSAREPSGWISSASIPNRSAAQRFCW